MRCNKCGEKLSKNDTYCPICGERYSTSEKPVPKKNKVFINYPRPLNICFAIMMNLYLVLIVPGLVAYLFGKASVLLAVIIFCVISIPFELFWISTWDRLEIIDGKQIKIFRMLRRKNEIYEISNIAYITDETPFYVNNPKRVHQRYTAYSKEGLALFNTVNSYDMYILFDYYGIEMRIYHGV